jgi:hypothetical protein
VARVAKVWLEISCPLILVGAFSQPLIRDGFHTTNNRATGVQSSPVGNMLSVRVMEKYGAPLFGHNFQPDFRKQRTTATLDVA